MKTFKKIIFLFGIFAIGGLGGVVADKYIFPRLATTNFFKKYEFLKRAVEDVTIINKTEQVYIKEETSLNNIFNKASSSVVNVVSLSSDTKKASLPTKNGTGLIVTSDGLILTHSDALNLENSQYKVLAYNGNSYDAEFLGVDSYSDLAFLKIDANNLPAISFGNSDDSTSGEKIILVGNNGQNYYNKYKSGLLSYFNPVFNLGSKVISSSEKLEGVFSLDINSDEIFVGGPIVDYLGQTIGVIGVRKNAGESEYFEIPSNEVKKVVEKAIRGELDKNAYLGIYYMPITKTFSLENKLSIDKGAMIYSASGQQGLSIVSGSPAQKAGLRINDLIIKIDDEEINSEKSLSELIYQHKKGEEIDMTILRDGQEIKIKVQL